MKEGFSSNFCIRKLTFDPAQQLSPVRVAPLGELTALYSSRA